MTRQAGFTLVEMLVALSVSALLIGLAYGAVLTAQRSARAVHEAAEQSETMRIGWQFMADAISRAYAVPDPQDRDDPTGFRGTQSELSFVADLPGNVSSGGLARISLAIEAHAGGQRLVVSQQQLPHDRGEIEPASQAQGQAQATLVDELDSIHISYLGRGADERAATWHDQWQAQPYLPSLVKIEISPAGHPAWPLLIARPLSGAVPALVSDGEDPDQQPTPLQDAPEPVSIEAIDDAT